MKYFIKNNERSLSGSVQLTSSKSESNRALLINALSGDKLTLENLSEARDTQTMNRLIHSDKPVWDVLDAGTTMRFCTAYLAVRGQGTTITGTDRMKQRPIGLLADALIKLGAKIDFQEKTGYPPLQIHRLEEQLTDRLEIPGNISSQFISALLMIAPCLPNGLEIHLTTEVYSKPYIDMTLGLMKMFGVHAKWDDQTIKIEPQSYKMGKYTIESDWSGASYWYAIAALNRGAMIKLIGLREKSFQGDQEIVDIMKKLGVNTIYDGEGAQLVKTEKTPKIMKLDFKKCPDLAQTVMVVAAAKKVKLEMTGLESLRIKETDRIAAMQTELAKIGTTLEEGENGWILTPGTLPSEPVEIATYDDHRMAMAFAPLGQVMDIYIQDPDVVKKSYPAFWDDLKAIGIEFK